MRVAATVYPRSFITIYEGKTGFWAVNHQRRLITTVIDKELSGILSQFCQDIPLKKLACA